MRDSGEATGPVHEVVSLVPLRRAVGMGRLDELAQIWVPGLEIKEHFFNFLHALIVDAFKALDFVAAPVKLLDFGLLSDLERRLILVHLLFNLRQLRCSTRQSLDLGALFSALQLLNLAKILPELHSIIAILIFPPLIGK